MGLECGWRHAQKRWSWEFKDFEKTSVEIGALRRELGFLPLRHAVEFSDLDRQRWIEILNITRCAARWGGVSIVWLA